MIHSKCQRDFVFAMMMLLLPASQRCLAQTSAPLLLESQGIRLQIGSPWRDHLRTEVDGIPFLDTSRLYAIRPNAGGRYYGYEDDPALARDTSVTKHPDGTLSATLPLRAPRGEFVGFQTVEILSGRRLRLAVDARMTTTTGGRFEHRLGGIFSGWIQGRRYSAEEETFASIPLQPHSADLSAATIVPSIRTLRIDTPVGPLSISAEGAFPVALVDYRLNPFFEGQPHFYLGIPERPLGSETRIRYSVTIGFPPELTEIVPRTDVLPGKPATVSRAFNPETESDVVVPTPKNLTWGSGTLPLSRTPRVLVEDQADKKTLEGLVNDLGNQLREVAGAAHTSGPEKPPILLRLVPSRNDSSKLEEYRLIVSDHVEIEAPTTHGLLAGTRTLLQLVRDGGTTAPSLRRCTIQDWASLPYRGVHFFSGAGGEDTQCKMIRDLVGPLKLNSVVYHCDNIQWESHPEIRQTGAGMPKEAARKVAAEARRQHVGMVPLINTFGHCNWLLENDRWRHLADDPKKPFAYDPTHPETYPLVHDIYREAVELFSPSYFHIGHDEITLKGFPLSPHLQKIGARKLILDDIRHYRNWFAAQGIRTMIWGDMFIGPGEACDFTLAPTREEAHLRRSGLPKDVVICDWHYLAAPSEEFVSLDVLNRAGFDTIASTWYHSGNITQFAKAAADARTSASVPSEGESLGLLETTWAGYNLNEKAIQQQPDQFAAYVLTAEAAWNGGSTTAEKLPYDYRQYFARLWLEDRLPIEPRPGWTVDLAPFANYELPANTNSGERKDEFRSVVFQGPHRQKLTSGVLLAAHFNPLVASPTRVRIPIDSTARTIAFATAATFAGAAEPPVARTVVFYDDESTAGIDWKLGQNVLALDDSRATPEALILQRSRDARGTPQNIHCHLWKNTKPAGRIRSIVFESAQQGSGFILFGITGIQ